jgi:hypothetical protein
VGDGDVGIHCVEIGNVGIQDISQIFTHRVIEGNRYFASVVSNDFFGNVHFFVTTSRKTCQVRASQNASKESRQSFFDVFHSFTSLFYIIFFITKLLALDTAS